MSPFRGVARLLLQRAAVAAQHQSGPCTSALAGAGSQYAAVIQRHAANSAAGNWALSQQHQRGISSSSGAWNKGPGSLLEAELKHEKESYVKPEAIAAGPPAPFVLTDAPGDTLLTLTRTYGNEQISVDLHVNNQPEPGPSEADGDAEEELTTVLFNVHITKGDESLVFECESDGLFVAINHLSHEKRGVETSDSTYSGPVFDELDDSLQQELRDYIKERGITPELGEYLRHMIYDKEVREYQAWLQRVADFVKK